MIIKPTKRFGRFYPISPREGQFIEVVILKYPDLINWLSDRAAPYGSAWLPGYIQKCIDLFDAKPFTITCAGKVDGKECMELATRFSLYPNSTMPMFWCASCDPSQQGAMNLTVSSCYYDALLHVDFMEGTRQQFRNLISKIATAKGYEGNFTGKKVIKFFYGPDANPIFAVDEDAV